MVIQTQKKSTIPWSHLKIMMFVNPGESWSSKTEIIGYDQQLCPGNFPFFYPFVSCLSIITVKDRPRSGGPERTILRKPRSGRLRKMKTKSGTLVDGSSHPGPGQLHPHLLPGENGAQTRRVSVLIGNHQPIRVAQTKGVSVPINSQLIGTAQMKRARLRHGSHRSHSHENEYLTYEDIHKVIHDDKNNVCL